MKILKRIAVFGWMVIFLDGVAMADRLKYPKHFDANLKDTEFYKITISTPAYICAHGHKWGKWRDMVQTDAFARTWKTKTIKVRQCKICGSFEKLDGKEEAKRRVP